VLTDDQKRDFADLGFLILRGFYSEEEIARVGGWLADLEELEPEPGREAKYYEASDLTGEALLIRVENIFDENNAEMRDLVLNNAMRQVLHDLLDEPAVVFKDKANYKLPGSRSDLLHQDQAAGWGTYADYFVTAMVAVDENTHENAPLSIMKSGNYQRGLMTEEWQLLSDGEPPFEPVDEYTTFEAKPGDVLLFDCFIPHGSPANTSDRTRRNLYLTFNRASAGDHRARYYADKWKNYPPNTAAQARSRASFRV
jgi:ectoine hydroxylase-related dioxygenase (phytanoyl-CoA dioxygenase family)